MLREIGRSRFLWGLLCALTLTPLAVAEEEGPEFKVVPLTGDPTADARAVNAVGADYQYVGPLTPQNGQPVALFQRRHSADGNRGGDAWLPWVNLAVGVCGLVGIIFASATFRVSGYSQIYQRHQTVLLTFFDHPEEFQAGLRSPDGTVPDRLSAADERIGDMPTKTSVGLRLFTNLFEEIYLLYHLPLIPIPFVRVRVDGALRSVGLGSVLPRPVWELWLDAIRRVCQRYRLRAIVFDPSSAYDEGFRRLIDRCTVGQEGDGRRRDQPARPEVV